MKYPERSKEIGSDEGLEFRVLGSKGFGAYGLGRHGRCQFWALFGADLGTASRTLTL